MGQLTHAQAAFFAAIAAGLPVSEASRRAGVTKVSGHAWVRRFPVDAARARAEAATAAYDRVRAEADDPAARNVRALRAIAAAIRANPALGRAPSSDPSDGTP